MKYQRLLFGFLFCIKRKREVTHLHDTNFQIVYIKLTK